MHHNFRHARAALAAACLLCRSRLMCAGILHRWHPWQPCQHACCDMHIATSEKLGRPRGAPSHPRSDPSVLGRPRRPLPCNGRPLSSCHACRAHVKGVRVPLDLPYASALSHYKGAGGVCACQAPFMLHRLLQRIKSAIMTVHPRRAAGGKAHTVLRSRTNTIRACPLPNTVCAINQQSQVARRQLQNANPSGAKTTPRREIC